MKKTVCFCIVFTVFGVQFGFSQFFLGGSASFQINKLEIGSSSSDSSTLALTPLLGYRFGKADVGVTFYCQLDPVSTNNAILGGGVFGSYIFFTKDKFSILGRGSLLYKYKYNYTTTVSLYYVNNNELTLNTITVSIAPIFEFKLFEHITLYTSVGSIGFSHHWGKEKINNSISWISEEDITGNSFGFSVSPELALGVYVVF